MLRRMEGKESFIFHYPIISNGKSITNSTNIANQFASTFSTLFNSHKKIKKNYQLKQLTISTAIHIDYTSQYNSDFSLLELDRAIQSINEKSSMGNDYIHNTFLAKLTKQFKLKLLNALNNSWAKGIFPDDLKTSILIPILKQDKDKTSATSYRPISLLSCLGKLIERMVYNRIYIYLENNNLFSNKQCGFRKKHSCIDILLYLEHYIQIALRTKKVLLIVFFDIEKAFDSASHIAILHSSFNKEIKGRMLRWITDFLSNRNFTVRVNNSYSQKYPISTGVPQGAILSPLLFNILMSDLPAHRDVHCLMYADDISAFVIENSMEVAVENLQNFVDSWKIKLFC